MRSEAKFCGSRFRKSRIPNVYRKYTPLNPLPLASPSYRRPLRTYRRPLRTSSTCCLKANRFQLVLRSGIKSQLEADLGRFSEPFGEPKLHPNRIKFDHRVRSRPGALSKQKIIENQTFFSFFHFEKSLKSLQGSSNSCFC